MNLRQRCGLPVPFHTRLRPLIQRRLKAIAALEGKHIYRVIEDAVLVYFAIHSKAVFSREIGSEASLPIHDIQLIGAGIAMSESDLPVPSQAGIAAEAEDGDPSDS